MNLLRVLVVAPEIEELPKLAQTSELTRLGDVQGVDVDPLIGPLVTIERIQSLLRNNRYDLLLWSGHGLKGRLLLPGKQEVKPHWLASEAQRAGISLVILAVCGSAHRRDYSGFADVLPSVGIHLIAMTSEVSDTGIIDYDVALLHALANRETLRDAHLIGLEAIRNREDITQPQLFAAGNPLIGQLVTNTNNAPPSSLDTLTTRLHVVEKELQAIWNLLKPSPRRVVARIVFYGLLAGLWSMWMIKEIRDWLILHPAQAVVMTIAVILASLIIRWLPEEDDHA